MAIGAHEGIRKISPQTHCLADVQYGFIPIVIGIEINERTLKAGPIRMT